MDRQVNIQDYQEVPAGDLMNMQTYVQAGADDLIRHVIHDGQAYAGFPVSATGTFEITIGAGLSFSDGRMYASRAALVKDLVQYQPVANKVAVAVIAWGTSSEQEPDYRDYLVNLDTEETEARQVNTVIARVAELSTIGGTESGDPQLPNIPLDRVLVATVILTTTGIESITMNADASLSSVLKNDVRIAAIEDWREIADPQISTIATDVANLSNAQTGTTQVSDHLSLAADVARLKEALDLPDTYADYGSDWFLTSDESDSGDAAFLAKVEEGIRFSAANETVAELALFSAINADVTQTNGLLLPKFTSQLRLSVSGYVGEQSITQYTQTSFAVVRKDMARQRIRWGQIYIKSTNSRFWRSGTYDPVTNIFTRDGETFQIVKGNPARHSMVRLQQFWEDSYTEPYWDAVETEYTLDGAQVAQTFLNSQAGWLTGIDLYFTQRGASGNVFLTLCELTPSGTPDLANAIQQVTVDYLDLASYPAATTVEFTPTYLEAGRRYAIVLTTQGNHYIAMADGGSYLSGTFFYSTDGAYFAGDITKDMMFGLRYAKFSASRIVVDMQPVNLDGGIAGLDILAPLIEPDACDITFQVDVPGQGWTALSDISQNALTGLPPLLPLQIVFQGTPDLHAGIMLTGSQLKASRPRTTFKHISTLRTLASSSDTIRIEWLLGNWDGGNHTFTASIDTGGGTETPDVIEDTALADDQLKRVMTFNLGAAVASFTIIADGTTNTALDVFHVEERIDIEF